MPETPKDEGANTGSIDAPEFPGVAMAQLGQIVFKSKKIFLGYEEGDNPELEPTFTNHFELFVLGSDIFLDVGVVKPEQLAEAATASTGTGTTDSPLELPFYVTHRIAMSYDTFAKLHYKVTQIHSLYQKVRDGETSINTR